MRDNYDPDGPRKEWPAVRPPHPDTAIYEDFATRLDQAPAAARDGGLRRLSRLTWRTTQLSAVAAAAFAILFARTPPTQAPAAQPAAAPAVKPSSAAAPPPTLAPPTTAPTPAPSPSAVQSTSS